MSKKKIPFINRDLSWLSFNARVLQEAADPNVPLIERLRFLGIFSNNRDEFFRVRVATLRRMARWPHKAKNLLGEDPIVLLEQIQKIVIRQQKRFDEIHTTILAGLSKEKIEFVNEQELNAEQQRFVRQIFHETIYPLLFPIILDSAPRFPYLKDKSSYLAIRMVENAKKKQWKYALIEIPTDQHSRFILLPSRGAGQMIILLDDVIRFCLDDVFSTFEYESLESYAIKLTRDSELDIDSDVSKSWMEKISRGVKARKKGQPVRLAFDEKIPGELLRFIQKKIKLTEPEYLMPGGRYHNFKDFINFPYLGQKHLRYPAFQGLEHPLFKAQRSLFKVIRRQDVLLAYPYQTFRHIIDLLREASIDPKVTSIRITLYRAASASGIINSLINAVKNGKQVTAVVELQARFDEEANLKYASTLQDEGVQVVFGVPGLKVHSKLILITRKEGGKPMHYAHLGTGNFNEQTARIYCDHSVLTANKKITTEVVKLFGFYQYNFKTGTYKRILVSPFNMRKKFIQLIQKEIENAKAGRRAYMVLKMNSLVDPEMIRKLYQASAAGVKIKMIVRGICSLVTDLRGYSDNIEIISIVDKFLEHSRIFVFANGGDEKFYISSADWMYRNLDFRSEVAIPVYDTELQMQLRQYLLIQLRDNTKARIINRTQDNRFVTRTNGHSIRAHEDIYRWLSGKMNPGRSFDTLFPREIAVKVN